MKRIVFLIALSLVLAMIAVSVFAEQGNAKRTRRPRMENKNQLEIGDMAPTFKLKSLDGKEETELEKFRGKKPVVLLFGSYS